VGADLVTAAVGWWRANFGAHGWPLKVHAMEREAGAVAWWTGFLRRPSDFTGAFMRNRPHLFPAVGWVIDSGELA